MPNRRDDTTIGTLVRQAIDEGCRALDITRGEVAERIGMHRVSLYNLLARPAGISLQSLVRLLGVLEVPKERQGLFIYKWCEDRTASNHFAELLFPVIEDLCREHKIRPEEMGARILKVFKRLQPKS